MRIVIDLQAAQSPSSKFGGVGRYAREITKSILKEKKKTDEIFLALNGYYENEVIEIRNLFHDLIPQKNIKVWNWYPDVLPAVSSKSPTKSEVFFHEWFLHQFKADVIFTINFQEGLFHPGLITSICETPGSELRCAMLHDISPMLIPEMKPSPDVMLWYRNMIDYCKKCDCIITVSEFSKQKISTELPYKPENILVANPGVNRNVFSSLKKVKKKKRILYVGGASEYKNVESLIIAFSKLPKNILKSYDLCIAGKEFEDNKKHFLHLASKNGISKNIVLKGKLTDKMLVSLMRESSLFVFPSLAEGFGMPPSEAISCGTLSLVSNTTSLPEVVGSDSATFNPRNIKNITSKILEYISSPKKANDLLNIEKATIEKFNWDTSAKKILNFFEYKLKHRKNKPQICSISSFKNFSNESFSDIKMRSIAKSFADSEIFNAKKHIYIDLSAVVVEDYVTGIQRVCNAIVENFKSICANNKFYEVIPVYSSPLEHYFIACDYKEGKYTKRHNILSKDVAQFCDGDILFMPDLHPANVIAKKIFLKRLVNRGVGVYTLLHDVIPTHFPEYFSEDFVREFKQYLSSISHFSGVIANSKTTMNDYLNWCKHNKIKFNKFFKCDYCYLGSDVEKANPSPLKDTEDIKIAHKFKQTTTFLVVGTIEPRKMHQQILDAFTILWKNNFNFNLVFVGRYGWKMDNFLNKIKSHSQLNKNFFWFQNASDYYLNLLYDASSVVIVGSLIEGFGLPIMEARYHNKPLILRDIPIFREVAEDNAMYFKGNDPDILANAIKKWYELFLVDKHPKSNKIKLIKWKDAAINFLDKLN